MSSFQKRTCKHALCGFRGGVKKLQNHRHVSDLLLTYRMSYVQVQCCFTFTETIRTIRDGEPRTATWTFTQLLFSDPVPEQFNAALRPQRPYRRLGTGSPGRPPPLSHSSLTLWSLIFWSMFIFSVHSTRAPHHWVDNKHGEPILFRGSTREASLAKTNVVKSRETVWKRELELELELENFNTQG